jgi:hypothetical protein
LGAIALMIFKPTIDPLRVSQIVRLSRALGASTTFVDGAFLSLMPTTSPRRRDF